MGDAVDDALRDVLGDASAVVRGAPLEISVKKTADVVFTYTKFAVSETLHGHVDADVIMIRQPGAGEDNAPPLTPSEDVIVLLDAREKDGAYPIHDYPSGRYRVQPGASGEVVVLNATGVDAFFLSPKDRRPRPPDELMPVDHFRVVAGAPSWELPDAAHAAPAASIMPDPLVPLATTTTAMETKTAPEKPPEPPPARTWIVIALALALAVAIAFVVVRRRR